MKKILKYIIKELNNYKVQSKENFEERSEKISFALKILKEEKYKIPIKVQEDLISFCFDFINDLYSQSIEWMINFIKNPTWKVKIFAKKEFIKKELSNYN